MLAICDYFDQDIQDRPIGTKKILLLLRYQLNSYECCAEYNTSYSTNRASKQNSQCLAVKSGTHGWFPWQGTNPAFR